jgi:hypothetical protein
MIFTHTGMPPELDFDIRQTRPLNMTSPAASWAKTIEKGAQRARR